MQQPPMPMLGLLAGELRRLRVRAGLSQEALGEKIRFSGSLVAQVEQCRRAPREEFTLRCDDALNSDGLLTRIREALIKESFMPWFREWVTIEQEATALCSFQPLILPGLLQTEAYARALHEGASHLAGDEMEQQVAARLARQAILTRDTPPMIVAVLDYTALERPIGGPKVMHEQLRHLLEVASKPKVHLHVVPRGAGAYHGLNGAFVIATPPEGEDIGYLDNQLQGTIVERTADIHSLRQTWESVRAEAMPHGATLKLISEAAETWT
ncbi:helix-turn-helix transcriptional regulator [Micromonospora sp. WMMD1082]|uniref:helix-turn-helix domain-containing protein n=1 Tax=Micromonospora sp. WMMD1082 TaxID=3016104 RepID=UPI002417F4D6|nr:helix-turn-helix transcriptional regulator [Micromonospora sp. WMMD1082]MDG4792399.1 helix-turn-helix transcriptional regulator [Micromonospora sp. WMMD1082]